MSSVFVSNTLLAIGPYVVPAFLVIVVVLLGIAVWLCRKPTPWRVGWACLILIAVVLQSASLVLP